MNVKLHTPKTLRAGSGLSSVKQFFLSLLATTISIVLTFGTAAVLDHYKKKAAKKEMVMMVISDFDKTINNVMKADTTLREASRLELQLAKHPEYFDSLRFNIARTLAWCLNMEFPETTEKVFSSSIETFNTIGNANFVNDVSSFYIYRDKYKKEVLDHLKNDIEDKESLLSIKALLDVSLPEYSYMNRAMLQTLKGIRDKCMLMMDLSEEELQAFSEQQRLSDYTEPEDATLNQEEVDIFTEGMKVIEQAKKKLSD